MMNLGNKELNILIKNPKFISRGGEIPRAEFRGGKRQILYS